MSLVKFGSTVATGNTLTPPPRPTAPMPPMPAPAVASNASPEIAELLAKLSAANAAIAAEKARADAAEAARAAGGSRGYHLKASEKGCVSIYGVSSRFPTTLYAPHLVGIVRDLVMTGKAAAFLRENADKLSVKVEGNPMIGKDTSIAEVRRLADELDRVTKRS